MVGNNKIEYLIVDTSAFIKNAALQDIGINVLTEQDVVDEITNKRQLRRLVVLPYDLKIQNAHTEDIQFVTEFAKKTGDYTSLSATDIKVIALTYRLEREKVGTEHLKTEPTVKKIVDSNVKESDCHPKNLVGFYMPQKQIDLEKNEETVDGSKISAEDSNIEKIKAMLNNKNTLKEGDTKEEEEDSSKFVSESSDTESEADYETASSDIESKNIDLADKFAKLSCESTDFEVQGENENKHNVDDILVPVKETHTLKELESIKYEINDDNDDEDDDDNDDDDDDESGWITPSNIKNVKKEMDSEILEQKPATVACLTMDFAMQNILMQIGLNVASLDGRVIKQMRTFIFRCYACFKTTSVMTKVFCPHCGNKTLKKVAVSLDDAGKQQIHINFRKPLSTKGKKFSLPLPKGGKHASNPILCEDQPLPDQRVSKLARTKNDPLQDDYIAGYSPFIMRDVNSKSAMLGIRPNGAVKYWMRRNPNESRRKRK